MEDPTIQQETPSYDASADGLAYGGYDEPAPQSEPTQPETPPETLQPDGIAVDENGELSYGDKFFEGIGEEPPETQPEQPPQPQAYTPEELKSTPFEQWELSRLKGDVSQFAPIVQEQIRQRNIQQAAQNAPLPEHLRNEPKAYTLQELSEAGMKLACEKLGITDVDDFDSYELSHQAAYQMALHELYQRRNAEIMSYRNSVATWPQLQQFHTELESKPDFNEFNQWFTKKLAEMKTTPDQMTAGMNAYVAQNGNDYTVAARMIAGWYQQFQRERGVNTRQGMRATPTQPRRITPPAPLEGTRGSGYEGERRVNLGRLGDMSRDEQANALMQLGIV